MAKTGDMIPSRFLKHIDIGAGQLWTIKKVTQEDIGQGDDAQTKWVLYFDESAKVLTLNGTNIKRLEKVCGSDESDNWTGKKIVVYWDEEVTFKGETTGGIRLRAPKDQKVDDLPF
jgi:hypothetical protein